MPRDPLAWPLPAQGLLAALVLWSLLWAGAYGFLVRRAGSIADPRILLLLGICASALGAVIVFSHPGLVQVYYLRGAAGAFGLLTSAGIAAILPARARDPRPDRGHRHDGRRRGRIGPDRPRARTF